MTQLRYRFLNYFPILLRDASNAINFVISMLCCMLGVLCGVFDLGCDAVQTRPILQSALLSACQPLHQHNRQQCSTHD